MLAAAFSFLSIVWCCRLLLGDADRAGEAHKQDHHIGCERFGHDLQDQGKDPGAGRHSQEVHDVVGYQHGGGGGGGGGHCAPSKARAALGIVCQGEVGIDFRNLFRLAAPA